MTAQRTRRWMWVLPLLVTVAFSVGATCADETAQSSGASCSVELPGPPTPGMPLPDCTLTPIP